MSRLNVKVLLMLALIGFGYFPLSLKALSSSKKCTQTLNYSFMLKDTLVEVFTDDKAGTFKLKVGKDFAKESKIARYPLKKYDLIIVVSEGGHVCYLSSSSPSTCFMDVLITKYDEHPCKPEDTYFKKIPGSNIYKCTKDPYYFMACFGNWEITDEVSEKCTGPSWVMQSIAKSFKHYK